MKKYGHSNSNVKDFIKQQKIKIKDNKYYIGILIYNLFWN
jgi:hypothetical protein